MKDIKEFNERIGRVTVPMAGPIPRIFEDLRPTAPDININAPILKRCTLKPKPGCYSLTFSPKQGLRPTFLHDVYKGTLRFEEVGREINVSADLYKFKTNLPLKFYGLSKKYKKKWGNLTVGEELQGFRRPDLLEPGPAKLPIKKRIPIYARNKYHSYLKGISANLSSLGFTGRACSFSLTFDQFFYNHPASGFNGSFPTKADRTVRMQLQDTDLTDSFEGKLFEGRTELGNVKLEWVSSFFRRAELKINRLEDAEIPQPVAASSGTGTEDFSTIFATAGWQLSVSRENTPVAMPASLVGSQDPDTCWSSDNSHDLMDDLPGYDPSELDRKWKAHLISIPAQMGCGRGRMFDWTTGNTNGVDREGAVTHSHDGYPSGSADFGIASDGLQKDFPRAFLRSASHEVGHTFNQIHQSFEGGIDNSVMTTTPAVAGVLDDNGDTFPDDIDLSFNETVRGHLIHLPDPAVRPGAMAFFGNTITAPEDEINFFDKEDLEVILEVESHIKLGVPTIASWTLKNRSNSGIPVPVHVDANCEVAHISVTSPSGSIRHMKTVLPSSCSAKQVSMLAPGKSRKASASLFWSKNGFAFETPGLHRVTIILLWEVDGLPLGIRGVTEVWIDFPTTTIDNEVAALMLNEEVGKIVAMGGGEKLRDRFKKGSERMKEVMKKYKSHPACKALNKL